MGFSLNPFNYFPFKDDAIDYNALGCQRRRDGVTVPDEKLWQAIKIELSHMVVTVVTLLWALIFGWSFWFFQDDEDATICSLPQWNISLPIFIQLVYIFIRNK